MSADSPASVLFTTDGIEIPLKGGVSIPSDARGFLGVVLDGATLRFAIGDSSGRTTIVGAGSAGTPVGGVISIQGVVGGTAVPVSGTVDVGNFPTTQTISGTVTANQGNAGSHAQRWMIGISDGSGFITPATDRITASAPFSNRLSDGSDFYVAAKTGQLPSSLVGGRLDVNVGAWIGSAAPTVGQKAMAASIPVVFPSDQTIPISIVGGGYGGQVEGRAANDATPVGNPIWIAGWDGASVRALKTDSVGRMVIAPSGAVASQAGFSFGDIVLNSTTPSTIRRTTYTEQTVNFQGSIRSASANDTSAGTGARTVKITYLDQSGAGPYTETVTLNGTTWVNLVSTTHCFIESIVVDSVGSTGSNQGVITLVTGLAGAGTTVGTIALNNNQTFWTHHYVPTGKTCHITGVSAGSTTSVAGSGSMYTLMAKSFSSSVTVDTQISDFLTLYGQSSMITRTYGTPILVTGPARIVMWVSPQSNSTITYRGSFDFYDQ